MRRERIAFKSLRFDPDSQPSGQSNRPAAEMFRLYLRKIFITDNLVDMMPSIATLLRVLLNPMTLLTMSPDPRGTREDNSRPSQKEKVPIMDNVKEYTMANTMRSPAL